MYARGLFIGLIPAALMLLVALSKRIGPYGLTELRVIAVALAVWLLAIAVLYVARRDTGIRTIPLSLAALLLVLLAGPMSAESLAVRSQTRRLARLMTELGNAPPTEANLETRRQISAAVRYLLARHEAQPLEAAFRRPIRFDDRRMCCAHADSVAAGLLATRTIRYVPDEEGRSSRYRYAQRPASQPLATHGFDWVIEVASRDTGTIVLPPDSLRYATDTTTHAFVLSSQAGEVLRFDVLPPLHALAAAPAAPADWRDDSFTADASGERFRARLVFTSLSGPKDSVAHARWSARLLIARQPADTAR